MATAIINIQQQKANSNSTQHSDKMNLKREEMNLKRELKDKDVQIAKENKNRFDVGGTAPKAKDDKKKK